MLLSFGLILLINEGQRVIFGNDAHGVDVPAILNYSIPLSDTLSYPAYRLFVCAVGIAVRRCSSASSWRGRASA